MRISWLSLVVLVASVGTASAEHRSATERARATNQALSLVDIDARVKPVSSEIGQCYLDATTRGGQLLVQLEIHRRGTLDAVTVQAPGLPAQVSRKIEACVRAAVASLEFPARRTSTTAVLPYVFQRTDAPNAGPIPSCWSPRGCPGR
ncbi:MAG TPA: hypothetical protein VN253_28880 [Kofleriaceae bacterium]|nr:hypothetical protein [Kofleriaceae bacterium]